MKKNILLIISFFLLTNCNMADMRYKPEIYFEGEEIKVAEAIYYDNKKELVQWLEKGIVDINTPGKQGFTYLVYAIYCERFDMVKTLLEYGANPDQMAVVTFIHPNKRPTRPEKLVPLSIVSKYSYDIKYMKLLINYGANVNNNQTTSPIHAAILSIRASEGTSGKGMKKIKYLLEHGADINLLDWGGTPLLIAAKIRNFDLVNYFWEHGADPLYIDSDGASLGYYIQEELDLKLGTPESKKKVQILIKRLEALGVEFPVKLQKPEKTDIEQPQQEIDLSNNIIIDD